ncbi:hypothetical protein MAJ_10332, partial [Metarhizium majus ARSEF 297]
MKRRRFAFAKRDYEQAQAFGPPSIANRATQLQTQGADADIERKKAKARRQAKQAIALASINLSLATASGLIGGFVRHDANLGLGIGGIMLTVLGAFAGILFGLLQ